MFSAGVGGGPNAIGWHCHIILHKPYVLVVSDGVVSVAFLEFWLLCSREIKSIQYIHLDIYTDSVLGELGDSKHLVIAENIGFLH